MFIINLFILSLFYLKVFSSDTKICVNCRYYINNAMYLEKGRYGKCILFKYEKQVSEYEKRQELLEFLVTGYEKKKIQKQPQYFYCSTARDNENMCGKEGKRYEDRRLNNK